jgi:hypothetical protein
MRSGRVLLIPAGLVVAAILAFLLQDVIRQVVVTPLAYLWWVLNLTFSAIPQLILWIILVAVLILIVISSLVSWISIGRKPAEPARPAQGNVEILAGWVSKAGEGNYYKWMIANRLGKLWNELSGRFGKGDKLATPGEANAAGQPAPEALLRYLKAGMQESFVDYPLPRRPFMRKETTPFDIDVEEAVEFLESQMEERSGRKHS